MGIPDSSLLDLIVKVRSWLYLGDSTSDLHSFSGKMLTGDNTNNNNATMLCCDCCSGDGLGFRCRSCDRRFCNRCVPVAGDSLAEICRLCSEMGLRRDKSSEKIHPSSSSSPEPSFDGPRIKTDHHFSRLFDSRDSPHVPHSSARSDEEEVEESGKHFFSPSSEYNISDSDSISYNGRNESLVGTPSPSRINNNNTNYSQELVLKKLDDPTTKKDHHHYDDFEDNEDLWYPPPPEDESYENETSSELFRYEEDEEEEEGDCSGTFFSSSDGLSRSSPESVNKEPLRAVVQGHFRALVSQLLQGEGLTVGQEVNGAGNDWLDIVTDLAWQAAVSVKPDTSRGGSMDPGDYVKVKCIASRTRTESCLVKGVVCTKNIKHKRMTSQYKNPRLMILGGALEYQRVPNQLASFNTLLQQENDHLKVIISKIEAHRPNVLLVEKSVSSYAQECLLAKDISLVLNFKRALLERISRCTGALVTPSVDSIATTRSGHCELFRLEKFTEEHEPTNQLGRKPSKTLMFFEGCPKRRLGCTVLLKGGCREELKKVKHVVQYAVFAAYHLSLQTSFLADEGALLPKMAVSECQEHEVEEGDLGEEEGMNESGEESEYFSAADSHQSLLVSFSSHCVVKERVCERSRLMRIKFYGCFDKPLGRYLRDDLFEQREWCRWCKEGATGHVVWYTHEQGNLTIKVRRLARVRLAGEGEGRIWMWHRCLRCPRLPNERVPPATRRVVMSDAAWGLSFGKFLDLSFTANRSASCGHSLQKDCLRFYGFGSTVAFFRYSPINILSVHLPPPMLEFNAQLHPHWLHQELTQLMGKVETLYAEISDVLDVMETKSRASCELEHHITDLKELVNKERNDYIATLQPPVVENSEAQHTFVDVLELNRLRRALLVGSHVWDRRFYSLDSLLKRNVAQTHEPIPRSSFLPQIQLKSDSFKETKSPESPESDFLLWGKRESNGPEEEEEEETNSDESNLSERIDSAWTGTTEPLPASPERLASQAESLTFRRLVKPVRVNSFDSALRIQEQGLRRSFLQASSLRTFRGSGEFSRSGSGSVVRTYSEALSSSLLVASAPSFISSASTISQGVRMLLPQKGDQNELVIAVFDHEPTSVISYALNSKEYQDWIAQKPSDHEIAGRRSPEDTNLTAWQSFGSTDLDYMRQEDGAASSMTSLFSDTNANAKKSPHLRLSFGDEAAKFSVTCYFAESFESLRSKCCPSKVEFLRSLSRCKRWSAEGGKSNVYFAKSLDERFIVKQVTKTELESFEELGGQYFKYMTESISTGSPTSLAKVVGMYQVRGKDSKMEVMVMENLFFKRKVSRVYDLKGSARSRYSSNSDSVLLDMNLLETLRTDPIFLGSKSKRTLERAIWNDTAFLASVDVMDYSLLVGVEEERGELVMGIIDYIRQYTWDKHLETWVKASGILGGPKNAPPTIISPIQYKKRFRKAMTSYFLTVPDQWSSS